MTKTILTINGQKFICNNAKQAATIVDLLRETQALESDYIYREEDLKRLGLKRSCTMYWFGSANCDISFEKEEDIALLPCPPDQIEAQEEDSEPEDLDETEAPK